MFHIKTLNILLICISFVLGGCVANQNNYTKPLYQMEVIDAKENPELQIEHILENQLANISPGQRPPADSDEAGWWMMMDNAEAKYKTAGNLIRDKQLNEYVQNIVCSLSPEYCNDIRTYIIQKPYFNATMAPNGALVLWSGLLLRAKNEAQLASVLGHEIGHYLRRHSLQQMRRAIDTTSALAFFRVATIAVGAGIVGDIAYLASIGGLQAYGRDMEREADGYGLAFMSRAGYNPREASKLWRQVISEKEASDDKKFSLLIFDSHPPENERLEALENLADKIDDGSKTFRDGFSQYQEIIAPHRFTFIQDDLNLRDFKRSEVLLSYLKSLDIGPGEINFFLGEMYRLRNKEGDLEKAIAAYESALAINIFPPETYRALGLIYRTKGNTEQANSFFSKYIEASPGAVDREMINFMLSRNKQ